MKDYGVKHKVELEEREILYLVEILKQQIEDKKTIVGGTPTLERMINRLEYPVRMAFIKSWSALK